MQRECERKPDEYYVYSCVELFLRLHARDAQEKRYRVLKTHCMNILFIQFQNVYIFYSISNDKYSRLYETFLPVRVLKNISRYMYYFCHVYTVALANVQHTVYCFNHLLVYKDYLCMKRDGTLIGREGKTTFEQQHTICT